MQSILVLLSSYNGEKYIRKQIDSILNQQDVDVHLLVRDDGSKDSTPYILCEYQQKYINFRYYVGENKGFLGSFNNLVEKAHRGYQDFDYFAFADQDDLWYPNKLTTAIDSLSSLDKTKPLLFACNSDIIDSGDQKKGYKFREEEISFSDGDIIMYGTFQGCSMVFNKDALNLYASQIPQITHHDRWMCFICHFLGSYIYTYKPLFGYRIHGDNVIGRIKTKGVTLHKIAKKWRYFTTPQIKSHHSMAIEFYNAFGSGLTSEQKSLFLSYINYDKNLFHSLRFMCDKRYKLENHKLSSLRDFLLDILFRKL